MASKTSTTTEKKGKMYKITTERDGMFFSREVSILGIPLWIPQSKPETCSLEIVGEVIDVTMLPPNEEAGYTEAREALIFRTPNGSHWVVPIASAVYVRQFEEQRRPVIGDKLMIAYRGKAKKNKKPGFAPANLFEVNFFDATLTAKDGFKISPDGEVIPNQAQVS